ncbi:hypothetical protein [Paractinoplanes lichenicola]|uniref:Uncharacterized protein n=1 Tax=Paractinoplanes lichenicola TaxID=2802976 RepID=A0ABS1VE84_9ACTN|nr:hypothetical protein [Actinoplanes lichenicola]MBL7252984.1 hypothetical protein [Actinoplanes lichenicola]
MIRLQPDGEVAAVTAWATVHGIALLLIDGSLDSPHRDVRGLELAKVSVRWFARRTLLLPAEEAPG